MDIATHFPDHSKCLGSLVGTYIKYFHKLILGITAFWGFHNHVTIHPNGCPFPCVALSSPYLTHVCHIALLASTDIQSHT